MKYKDEPEKKLIILGWAFVIFWILFIIYVKEITEALKTFHINLPSSIIMDIPVVYVLSVMLYCHIKYRDKR